MDNKHRPVGGPISLTGVETVYPIDAVNPTSAHQAHIERQTITIEDMSLQDLRLHWRKQFGRSAPANLPRSLLLRLLIYKLQVEAHGHLRPEIARELATMDSAASLDTRGQSRAPQLKLRSGTLLVREHGGIQHRVLVTDIGLLWNGQQFNSLSQVARAITGTNWNGPRFFGLRGTANG
jgi:DUF2924 family protein